MTQWGFLYRNPWWMKIYFSLSPLLSCPLSLFILSNSSTSFRFEVQRTFGQSSQTLIRRGASDEITLGFGMSSSSSPEAVRLNILTCYNNFLWAVNHWLGTNGSNRLHQELSWRVVDSFNPTMKIEWAIISKGKLDPACICINTPKMTQPVPHPAQQSGVLLMFYLVSMFGWETSNALLMCCFYEHYTKNILCERVALLCSALLISVCGLVGDVAVRIRTSGFWSCHSDWDSLPTKCIWELLAVPATFWKQRGEPEGGPAAEVLVVLVRQCAVAASHLHVGSLQVPHDCCPWTAQRRSGIFPGMRFKFLSL